jgi:hypothetical protein
LLCFVLITDTLQAWWSKAYSGSDIPAGTLNRYLFNSSWLYFLGPIVLFPSPILTHKPFGFSYIWAYLTLGGGVYSATKQLSKGPTPAISVYKALRH